MALEWASAIIETPYLIVPIIAWLWGRAKFPQFKWNKIAAGALMTFGGKMLGTLILAMGPFLANEWMAWPGTIISLVGTVSLIMGLGIIGFYTLYGALLTWKSNA
ncbi:MAG: hypothetical protein GOV01_00295 [Candidatus Altiarchaeota archaeon]|nr:hypothetical protein [Candidatus Altiarchaeota archaeon]